MPESSTTLGLGTPGYAPMEQSSYKSDGSFPATLDIYALGATLYKMLTGKTPPDSPTVFNEGLDLEPMVTHSVPSWLQNAVVKTMSPGKRQRPQTAKEFKTMLVTGQNGTALSAKKQRMTMRRHNTYPVQRIIQIAIPLLLPHKPHHCQKKRSGMRWLKTSMR